MSATRIPFALVGVMLLVGSATFAGSLGGPTVDEPDVDRAMDRTESATQSAVRAGVSTAAVDAARNPVTIPGSSQMASELSRTNTFRDALRVRIYVAVRDRLGRVSHRSDGVTVTADLPATPNASALGDAIERISISRAGSDGTDLRATVQNVTLTAERNGRVVGQRTVSPTVTVPVPTLAVHDRVSAFERRLDAGPTKRGLGRRLTAQLYALTWTRGYAQFGGAPIENVLASRHLSLLTNSNVLSMQRHHFGESDPRGRSVLQWAAANTAITDAIDGSDNRIANKLSEFHDIAGLDTIPSKVLSNRGATDPTVGPSDEVTIGVNSTADEAYFEMLETLEDSIDQTYTATVELRQRVRNKTERVVREPSDPGSGWELARKREDTATSVSRRSSPSPTLEQPWHLFEYYPREVTVRTTITRVWNTSDGQVETVEIREERADVDVVLVGRHDGGSAPNRPFQTVHEPGGPLGGPNLERIESTARERLLGWASVADLAVEAVEVDGQTITDTVRGDQPEGIYDYVYEDVRRLRERVRDLSVTTTRGKLATFQVNPGRRLQNRLDAEWDDLLAAPTSYGAAPGRARTNARALYLQTVRSKLQERAQRHRTSRESVTDQLDDREMRSLGEIQRDYGHRDATQTPTDLDLQMRVETAPSYLTVGELDGSEVPTLPPGETTYPLVTRNVNFFTVPYGDLAEGIVQSFFGPEQVRLQTAVQTLKAAQHADDETMAVDVERLREAVEKTSDRLASSVHAQLVLKKPRIGTVGGEAIEAALNRWDSTVARGEAWVNGSIADAIHEAVTRRVELTDVQRDLLWLRLRIGAKKALESTDGQAPKPIVNETSNQLRGVVTDELSTRLGDGLEHEARRAVEKASGRTLGRLPAGMPLAPPFGPWVTTINYWQVQVRGEYTRFTVSVPRGTPDTPGGRFAYVRDGATVRLDVTGDGTREVLGRTSRVSFETNTSVAIAVPPGMRGVGDVDGVQDEQSPGWPDAGRATGQICAEVTLTCIPTAYSLA